MKSEIISGPNYADPSENARLTTQLNTIFNFMRDSNWRTLRQIAEQTGYPESSISAQLRHLRKPSCGSHEVNKRHIKNGLYEYQVIVNEATEDGE